MKEIHHKTMNPNIIAAINLSLSIGGWAFPIISNTATIVNPRAETSLVRRNNYARQTSQCQVVAMSMTSDSDSNSSVDSDDNDKDDGNSIDRIIYPSQSPQQSESYLGKFDETIEWEPMDIDEMDDFYAIDYPGDDYVDIHGGDVNFLEEFDRETLLEILGLEDDGKTITISENEDGMLPESNLFLDDWNSRASEQQTKSKEMPLTRKSGIDKGIKNLERALMGGVVPVEAGVGSGMLPCDYGFDPLNLSTKDFFKKIQNFILNLVPARKSETATDGKQQREPEAGAAMPTVGFVGQDDDRPPALILRDYREAEIRHGRLAMLAAIIWPMQEILDRIFIPDSFGSTTVMYGGPTLPFMPLIMTFFMLNLGYLDIYSSEIKENESGDAFLPGECFWDPLCVMQGASDRMKRNMQEREILNGRAAMIAVSSYIFEEAMTHKPLVALPTNALLFMPAYQVPFIQQWLDFQFGNIDYSATSIIDPGL